MSFREQTIISLLDAGIEPQRIVDDFASAGVESTRCSCGAFIFLIDGEPVADCRCSDKRADRQTGRAEGE